MIYIDKVISKIIVRTNTIAQYNYRPWKTALYYALHPTIPVEAQKNENIAKREREIELRDDYMLLRCSFSGILFHSLLLFDQI